MEARFHSARLLKQIVDGVKPIASDVNLQCDGAGLSLQAMDASHVALCTVRLGAEAMASYACAHPVVLGLPLSNLSKVLATVGPDARLTLSATGTEALHVHAVSAPDREARFVLNLMDIDSDAVDVPAVPASAPTVTMPSAQFKKTVLDAAALGDACRIAIGPSSASFSATGELGSGTITLRASADVVVSHDGPDEAALSFPTRYLELFSRCGVVASAVRLAMPDGQPLRVTWCGAFGSVEFCLAPQLEA